MTSDADVSTILSKGISDPVDGVKEDRIAARIKLLAKRRDVHLDKVSTVIKRIVVPPPALMEKGLLGDRVAYMFEEGDEQAKLDRCEA